MSFGSQNEMTHSANKRIHSLKLIQRMVWIKGLGFRHRYWIKSVTRTVVLPSVPLLRCTEHQQQHISPPSRSEVCFLGKLNGPKAQISVHQLSPSGNPKVKSISWQALLPLPNKVPPVQKLTFKVPGWLTQLSG